jgi:hypothetical protein
MVAILCAFFYFYFHSIGASEYVNYVDSSANANFTFFLSTPKSGTNAITGCLTALTRRPISWFYWGDGISDPYSKHRDHVSYNRLGLELIDDTPLLYRTHYELDKLKQVPSELNKLIFLTRNPKELLYRSFFLKNDFSLEPDDTFIEAFLEKYLLPFAAYETWHPDNRTIVFYEDFILNETETLLKLLNFMDEPPIFLEDFLNNKQEYLARLLQSYSQQHLHNSGGSSCKDGAHAIYYTKNAALERLQYIDAFLKKHAPNAWEKYLNRFETIK